VEPPLGEGAGGPRIVTPSFTVPGTGGPWGRLPEGRREFLTFLHILVYLRLFFATFFFPVRF
jgi:hypothetical protein